MPMMIQPQQNQSNKIPSRLTNPNKSNNNSTNNAQSEDRRDIKESNNRRNIVTSSSNNNKKGENKLKNFLKSILPNVLWDALKLPYKFTKFIINKIKENKENKQKAKLKTSHHRKNKHL